MAFLRVGLAGSTACRGTFAGNSGSLLTVLRSEDAQWNGVQEYDGGTLGSIQQTGLGSGNEIWQGAVAFQELRSCAERDIEVIYSPPCCPRVNGQTGRKKRCSAEKEGGEAKKIRYEV